MMTRRILGALLLAILLASPALAPAAEKTETVVTLKTNQGDILLRLFPEVAPEHVKNFLAHCESGFYTGCTWHRVIPGFMIQSGDPLSKDDNPANDGGGGHAYTGPGTTLAAEFSKKLHLRGTLSMARKGGQPDSAGSQFFICLEKKNHLNGDYTIFGEVIDGIETVDAIAAVKLDGSRPREPQLIEGVKIASWPADKVKKLSDATWKEDYARRKANN
jgi:peptidyl-prolyl cis-trans isomerase B (cyclophilin B)